MKEYYTPAIEEFHVGFKCEKLYFNDHPTHKGERLVWGEEIIDKYLLGDIIEDEDPEYIINNYRVKYLDREDIESCGWTKQSTSPNSINFTIKKTDLFLYFFTDSKEIIIDNGCIHESLDTFFQGTIRNISELKKLMKQLNIRYLSPQNIRYY